MPSASSFPHSRPSSSHPQPSVARPESSLPPQPVMTTANTNFGSSCTAKARPKKDTQTPSNELVRQGFDALRQPGRFSTVIALPHAIHLQASVITDAEPRG
ncbi:hypothetical protein MY11210_002144 [Beauveria gryllotalpidicola]